MSPVTAHTAPDPHPDLTTLFPGFDATGLEQKHVGRNPYFQGPTLMPEYHYVPRDCMWTMIDHYPGVDAVLEDTNFFKDKIVCDLGAGEESWAFHMALRGGARGYIAVEPCLGAAEALARSVGGGTRCWSAVVREDIEYFLPRLPDKSVSFIISGLSDQNDSSRSTSFVSVVRNELARSFAPDGRLLWFLSANKFLPTEWSVVDNRFAGPPILYRHDTREIVDSGRLLTRRRYDYLTAVGDTQK